MSQDPYRQTPWPPSPRIFIGSSGDLTIDIELPELRCQDIEITIEDRTLRLVYKRGRAGGPGDRDCSSCTANPGDPFEKAIKIPNGFQPSSARAAYLKGLLRIVVPKESSSQPPQIPSES